MRLKSAFATFFQFVVLLSAGSSFANSADSGPAGMAPRAEIFSQIAIGGMAPITRQEMCLDENKALFLPAKGQIDWNVYNLVDPSPYQQVLKATIIRRFDGFDVAVHILPGLQPSRSEKDFKNAISAAMFFAFGAVDKCDGTTNLIPINGIGLEGHSFLSTAPGETRFLPFVTRENK